MPIIYEREDEDPADFNQRLAKRLLLAWAIVMVPLCTGILLISIFTS